MLNTNMLYLGSISSKSNPPKIVAAESHGIFSTLIISRHLQDIYSSTQFPSAFLGYDLYTIKSSNYKCTIMQF